MTANWQAGWTYSYPRGYGDVEPMLAGGMSGTRKVIEKAHPDSRPRAVSEGTGRDFTASK